MVVSCSFGEQNEFYPSELTNQMDRFLISGGRRLDGEIQVSGAKNACLPQMAACLLPDGDGCLRNVPDVRDVHTMAEVLSELGADCSYEDGTFRIDSTSLDNHEAPYDMVRRMRASVYVLGPLLARLHKAKVSLPGGCAIGSRPIDLHLRGFEAMGASINLENGYVIADGSGMKGAEINLEGPCGSSVGATCNILMAAVLTPGKTVIRGAAIEPEVGEVVRMLNLMGAQIQGVDSPTLEIEGVEGLHAIAYSTIPDRIEAGTFLIAAAISGGDVFVKNARPDHLNALLDKLIQAGVKLEIYPNGIRVLPTKKIMPVHIHTLPYPGFPTDMQAQMMALLCLAEDAGESLITEGIYPDRFMHAAELVRLGADIESSNGQARVRGVHELKAAPVMASDLRASAALVLAGLRAYGTTEILRVYHIDRGYQHIDEKLAGIGALINRE
jgi:UDP-N-acetylglucosamine 1-carboxyvinyltransferase